MATPEEQGERVLVLAPVGRDAALAQAVLERSGIASAVCDDLAAVRQEMRRGAGALLLTQEALPPDSVAGLAEALATQPPWSDLPLVVLVSSEAPAPVAPRIAAALGPRANPTFVERPVGVATLLGIVRAALRMRHRQYELRDHILARERAETAARRAQAEAERALALRDEVLASVAHDLKNPLTAVKGYAQLLGRRAIRLQSPGAEQLAQGLGEIDALVGQAVEQIDELLDLARLQAGQELQLRRAPLDLIALASRIVERRQQASDKHRIRIDTALRELPGVWDRRRIERALDNLLVNAVKYSPCGGDVDVTINRDGGDEGDWAVLAVRDRGIGIPEADLPHVFDRFYRASNVADRESGTGLGLAGARRIVEQHGGTIGLNSVEGQGTTVTVRLPLGDEETDALSDGLNDGRER